MKLGMWIRRCVLIRKRLSSIEVMCLFKIFGVFRVRDRIFGDFWME